MSSKQPLSGIVLVCFAVGLTLASCDFFSGKNSPGLEKLSSIAGDWKIVDIKDSSSQQKSAIGILALAMMSGDSSRVQLHLGTDSNYHVQQVPGAMIDSGIYRYDPAGASLVLRADSTDQVFTIKGITDTSLTLVSAQDSVWYSLVR